MQSHLFRALGALALGIAALGAQAQELPEGQVAIHYNRCDNNYEGWGLHTWKNPGIPLPGVEWQKPMPPTGKNDFGVFWQMSLAEYGNSGTVNYIIHLAETKEQGGRDMKFDGKANKAIWVNGGDRKIYYSLADAQAARADKPCQ